MGWRPVPDLWPYIPMPEIVERITWQTDGRQTRTSEARYSFRTARQEVTYQFNLPAEIHGQASQRYRDLPLGDWLVPLWWQGSKVSVLATDTTRGSGGGATTAGVVASSANGSFGE